MLRALSNALYDSVENTLNQDIQDKLIQTLIALTLKREDSFNTISLADLGRIKRT